MEYEGKEITREDVKKAVQEIFREERIVDLDRWYRNLSKQQRAIVDKIFIAEVQAQIDKVDVNKFREFKIMTVGEYNKKVMKKFKQKKNKQ